MKTAVKQWTLAGVFSALAVALSALESMLPPLPVAGAKLGLANLAVMAALLMVSLPCAAGVTAVKIGFALFRGPLAFAMSAAGSVLSLVAMAVVYRLCRDKLSCLSLGLVGAVMHNAGQWIMAYVLLGKAMVYYAPLLFLMSIPAGLLTGLTVSLLKPYLENITKG